jgi:sugar O-acyltransferase (sialic acid O-acetyltransferase NeuD family)
MKKIAIYGAGGFGREIKMLIEQINLFNSQWEFIGFYDDGRPKGSEIAGSKILGGIQDLNNFREPMNIVVAIGDPKVKKTIIKNIENDYISYPILVHPNTLIGSNNVHIGNGTIICAGNILTVDISLGEHVILNLSCTVGHDTIIHDFCSFMPSVNISGEVIIYECVYVGTGAKIINKIEIGENSTIGAGAVVSKTIPSNCTAVGIPAKPIKFHNE